MPFTQAVISQGGGEKTAGGALLDCKQTERQLNAKHLPGFPARLPLSPSLSYGFFKFATAKKHKEHNEECGGRGVLCGR